MLLLFSASNSGGSGDESESDLRTNVYANIFCNIVLLLPLMVTQSLPFQAGVGNQRLPARYWCPWRNIWATAPRATAMPQQELRVCTTWLFLELVWQHHMSEVLQRYCRCSTLIRVAVIKSKTTTKAMAYI